jgi:hypothetical protein
MNWLDRLSRNLGLMIHNVRNPDAGQSRVTPVRKSVEEQQITPTTILRRTTIEEVEIRNAQVPGQDRVK